MEIKTEPVDVKYEIGDDIGRGKFATVKRCRDRQTGSEYAAKFIRKSLGMGRRGAKMENIEKEIQILSETNHRNIINLYEVYGTKREVILILELVDGGELFEYLSEKDKLCEEEASSFVKQILEGVEHLHSQDIAHLDLKPENILLQDKNSTAVKLIDFGLSRKILPKEDHRAIMGTAEFCAPEVISFEPLSVSTDMWSIGVITYVLLSGLSPFLGDNQQETYHNITSINFEFDEEYFNGTSELAKDFIQKLLVKDTRKRATIHQCLNHPWIKPVEKRDKVLRRSSVINTEHLKKFIARQRWKRSMKVVSLCNRLSRSMQLRRIMSTDTIGSTSEEDIDELTDTERCAGDRESTEIDNRGKESVEIHDSGIESAEMVHSSDRESIEIHDSGRESVEMHNTERESDEIIGSSDRGSAAIHIGEREATEFHISEGETAEIIHNSDSNIKESVEIHHIDGESNVIENGNKESTETYSSAKELAETPNSDKELAEIHISVKESCEIHNTDRESVEIHNTDRESVEIHNNDREFPKIRTSDRESAEIHNSDKESADICNTDKELSEIHSNDKESTEIHNSNRESVEIPNIGRECFGIIGKAAGENHSSEATHMKLLDSFDENKLESNLQKSFDLQIPESVDTGISEDPSMAETSVTKTAELEHMKTAETGALESAERDMSRTPESESQSENKEISVTNVLPETHCLEIVECHNLDPNFEKKCIEAEDCKLASRNVIGEFDDDIGQFVEGLNLDTENKAVKDDTSYEPPYEIGGTEIGVIAQKFVTGVIERSIGYISEIEHETVMKSTSKEGSFSSRKEEEKAKSHLKQYDPLKLVYFEIDEGLYEELVEEQNQIDKEKANDEAKLVGSEMENVHPEDTIGEKNQRSDEHNKLFKPLTTSKFELGVKKHPVRRPVKRQRKARPELKAKKKANRFWEMEDCDETGRYEMFEMQVLNNSE